LPPRWDVSSAAEPEKRHRNSLLSLGFSKWTLVLLNIAILLFCVISAWNAAATHDSEELNFTYHPYIRWLPHSFDNGRTWLAFWNYLALSFTFWAIADWLPGKSGGEERAARQKSVTGCSSAPTFSFSFYGACSGCYVLMEHWSASRELFNDLKARDGFCF
jgi:hypothetical protein